MLRYLARTLPVVFRARRRERQRISTIERRVRLGQIDTNLHMNQAAYAQVGELGRADWVFSCGVWGRWSDANLKPVVAEQRIVYRRELRPLQRFVVDTRAVAIEGRLLVLETHVLVRDRVHARLDVKLIFVGDDGVAEASVVDALNRPYLTKALPVDDWRLV